MLFSRYSLVCVYEWIYFTIFRALRRKVKLFVDPAEIAKKLPQILKEIDYVVTLIHDNANALKCQWFIVSTISGVRASAG